jgi:hypothetical protein
LEKLTQRVACVFVEVDVRGAARLFGFEEI